MTLSERGFGVAVKGPRRSGDAAVKGQVGRSLLAELCAALLPEILQPQNREDLPLSKPPKMIKT
ncbi:MAG: hypothetical protein AB8E87_14895 [Prochlorococcus sp.]